MPGRVPAKQGHDGAEVTLQSPATSSTYQSHTTVNSSMGSPISSTETSVMHGGFWGNQDDVRIDTSTDMPDSQLSNGSRPIKAQFQVSKASLVDNNSCGDTFSCESYTTLSYEVDDQLPHAQVQSCSMLNEETHKSRSDSYPGLSITYSNAYLPSTQIVAQVQDNLPQLGFLTHHTPKFPSSESMISNTAKSYQVAQSSISSRSFRRQSDTISSALLSKHSDSSQISDGSRPPLSAAISSIIASADSRIPFNRISCRERKRIIISPNRPPNITKAMLEWVKKTNWLLDPFRENEDCWLHPSPPPAFLTISGVFRPVGTLKKGFTWRDKEGKHSVALNYGIVVKLINHQLTKQQQDGFVNKQWHLSHLCGNWTCLNPAHTTVEPGRINISRNKCFAHRSGCHHTPECLKDKKIALGPDGKPADVSGMTLSGSYACEEWDNWSSPLLVDDNDSTMDDFEDSDSFILDNPNALESISTSGEIKDGGTVLESQAGVAEPVPFNGTGV